MEKTHSDIRNFSVDYNDPLELRKLIRKLTIRRNKILTDFGFKKNVFNGSTVHADFVLPIFDHIMSCQLDHLYEAKSTEPKYYVYVHCDPTQKIHVRADLKHFFLASKFNLMHVPFYVGKGIDNRWLDFNRNDSHRKIRQKIKLKNKDILPVKIKENLTEAEALSLESKLIDILGLRSYSKHGLLVNLDEGVQAMSRRQLYIMGHPKVGNILKLNGFLIE